MFRQRNVTEDAHQSCREESFLKESEECKEYVFDTSVFSSTVVTEFSLVCDGDQGQVSAVYHNDEGDDVVW